MNRSTTIRFLIGLPALMIHELSHYIMALILGVNVSGFKIDISVDDKDVFLQGNVFTKRAGKLRDFLIFSAPTITFIILFVISIFGGNFFIYCYLCFYATTFNVSKVDISNIKALFKNKEPLTVTDDELKEVMSTPNYYSNDFKLKNEP